VSSLRDAIYELHARYAFAIDAADGAAFAACFTEDGALRTNTPREVVGRQALAEFALSQKSKRGSVTRHVSWNVVIEVTGSTSASARCYAAVLRTGSRGPGVMLTAMYHDEYRFVDGAWQISERRVTIDGLEDDSP